MFLFDNNSARPAMALFLHDYVVQSTGTSLNTVAVSRWQFQLVLVYSAESYNLKVPQNNCSLTSPCSPVESGKVLFFISVFPSQN